MDPEELAGEALDQLFEITALLSSDMTRGLSRLGLTEANAHALFLLGGDGPRTQRELADALDVSPRSITTLVDELSAAGLVSREPHPTDRRATLVTPTRAGAEMADGLVEGRAGLAQQLFADRAPQQLAALVDGLDAVLAELRGLLEDEA